MRLRTRKLISLELNRDGAISNRAPDQVERESEENSSAEATVTESGAGMKNHDVQVISAVIGGYAFPAPSRYDDDAWDSDKMLLVCAPWFNSATLMDEDIVPQYTLDGWLPGGIQLSAAETWAVQIISPVMMAIHT